MIKKELLELHKPSELCQVVCLNNNKNLVGSLTTIQIDIMNYILYRCNEKIKKEDISEIDEFFTLQLPLNDFNKYIGLNKHNVYSHIIENLIELKMQLFVFNALLKNKKIENTITSFIHKIKYTRHKMKEVKLTLDGEIIKMLLHTSRMFTKFYLKIQFSMNSKYSKLLYEILRDYLGKEYNGCTSKVIDYELLQGVLNVDLSKKTNNQWSTFRPNILEKAVKEINEKSDIKVSYEPIKERPDGGRLQVTKIKFMMEKQDENRLKELGILDQEPELSIEEQIHQNKLKNKSKAKMVKLVKNGYEIKDEESWINTDIRKNEELYTAQYKLDDYIDALDDMELDSKQELLSSLATYLKTDDPIVLIDGYSIKDLSGNFLTTSAIETRKVILDFQEVSGSN